MLVISSREFRQNQRLYFDKVDKGEQIIVHRGKNKSYILTPLQASDHFFNEETMKKLNESIRQAEHGQFKEISSDEEIKILLGL